MNVKDDTEGTYGFYRYRDDEAIRKEPQVSSFTCKVIKKYF